MRSIVKLGKRGFTLVELMIVVAIIGVLAALAIYGVTRYVANAKTTEARTAVARISKDATTAYARPKTDTSALTGGVLAAGGTAAQSNQLCASATAVPAAVPAGTKVQSATTDWGGSESAGWECLRFSMSDPQMYQYNYTAVVADGTFSAVGTGNLDGDATNSTFTMNGVRQSDGTMFVSPTVIEVNPME